MGILKPTYAVPKTMWHWIDAFENRSRCLLVDFFGLKGFSARQLIEVLKDRWPNLKKKRLSFPGNEHLWQQARALGTALGLELEAAVVGGASDGNLTSPHTPTLDGLGAVGGGAHQVDEHVAIEALPERAALLTLLLTAPLPTFDREEA